MYIYISCWLACLPCEPQVLNGLKKIRGTNGS